MSAPSSPLELVVEATEAPEAIEGWRAEVVGDPFVGEAVSGPVLVFRVKLVNESLEARRVTFVSGNLYAGKDLGGGSARLVYVAPAQALSGVPAEVATGASAEVSLAIPLTPEVEAGVERVRGGGDLLFALTLQVSWNGGAALVRASHAGTPLIRIAKSYWVERILAHSSRLRLAVIEVPGLPGEGVFKEAVERLSEAWTLYRLGDYKASLAMVRESLNALWEALEKVNSKLVEVRGKGASRILSPLFSKIAGNEVEALQARRMYRSVNGILAAVLDRGFNPSRESAELALMTAHALARFIASRAPLARS